MTANNLLADQIKNYFNDIVIEETCLDMVTIEVKPQNLIKIMTVLRDEAPFQFNQLIDICGVDYSDYGVSYWRTDSVTTGGYSRAVETEDQAKRIYAWDKPRFAVVYHLLSLEHNHRIRVKVFLPEQDLMVPSVIDIWACANWFEREAYDLFGIVFEGHPDLRRLLTDYGFKGHPFRKDFPLVGEVEMRYDAEQGRCVYIPVSIQPRVLVPKVIREDNRYLHTADEEGNPNA